MTKPTLRVMADQCESCIFRGGNLMHLREGRLAELLADCRREDSHVVCHETLDVWDGPLAGTRAVCRGFLDTGRTSQAIQIAERLGIETEIIGRGV